MTPSGSSEPHVGGGLRSGFVGLIGKPNVGKSTMVNYWLGRKIAITSSKPQTTRYRVLGILTRPDAQVMFMDCPGWHQPHHALGKLMVGASRQVLEEADLLVAVLEATSGIRREDEWVFEEIRKRGRPALLAINKVDLVKKPILLPLLEEAASRRLFAEHVPVSAVTGENMDVLLAQIIARLPPGPRWYEADQVTDQPTELAICELIREQVLGATHQEVPHAVAVLLDELVSKESVTLIRATIMVEREGQKAILIGRQGQMLKHIGSAARVELERLIGRRVFLELWVKVAEDWREDPAMLRRLGYDRSHPASP